MNPVDFGTYIKKLRHIKGLSITALAEVSGISQPYLSQIENGKRGVPTDKVLKKLAEAFNVEYADLLIKAGHVTETEWNRAFIQEGFHGDDDVVFNRAITNQQSEHIDLKDLLENINSISYNGWDLNSADRKQLLDMMAILFPAYAKEKRA